MKRKIFARKLLKYMQPRIEEILEKYYTKNCNSASYPAFLMGADGDINTFLKDKNLWIRKRKLNVVKKKPKQDKRALEKYDKIK